MLDQGHGKPSAASALTDLTDEELETILDDLTAKEMFEAAMAGSGWPILGSLIRAEVARQVERART